MGQPLLETASFVQIQSEGDARNFKASARLEVTFEMRVAVDEHQRWLTGSLGTGGVLCHIREDLICLHFQNSGDMWRMGENPR